MAKGKKTGGRDFTGQPGPGRPKKDPESKALARLTHTEFEACANKYILMPLKDLKDIAKNPGDKSALEMLIVSTLVHGINKGDQSRISFFLERLVGKPNPTTEQEMNKKQSVPTVSQLLSDAMRTTSLEIARLQKKAFEVGLSIDEGKMLTQLSRSVSEMVEQEDRIRDRSNIEGISDEELIKKADLARAVLGKNIQERNVQN
jgi:hypothetical protein